MVWIFPVNHLHANDRLPSRIVPAAPPRIDDVALQSDGVLAGQLYDSAGRIVAAEPVYVVANRKMVAETKTDQNGKFRVPGLKSGIYHVISERSVNGCRCWTPGTAPPNSKSELLVVTGNPIQRGQRPITELLADPLMIALIIGIAIAIPVIASNAKSDGS